MDETVVRAAEDFGFSEIMSPDDIPEDTDWHAIVGIRGEELHIYVAFFMNGTWWLDDNVAIDCLAWDRKIRMERAGGKPIYSRDGAADLIETIGHIAAKDYTKAYKHVLKCRDALDKARNAYWDALINLDGEELVRVITSGYGGGYAGILSEEIRKVKEARKNLDKTQQALKDTEHMFPDWLLLGTTKSDVFKTLRKKVEAGDKYKRDRRYIHYKRVRTE